tara:strand:- start:1394 stop:1888 length:495 start_codon:yes stop_codon:yes gene_type:complete
MDLKPIKDYEGLYSLDLNTNQVYSHYKNKYKKPSLNNTSGHYRIQLYKNNKVKYFLFHRLVYEAHKGIIPVGICIDHIDNDRTNNNIDNLRLATHSENSCNQKISKNNLLKHKNIRLNEYNNYNVRITKYYKCIYNKTFKTLEESIKNRDIQLELYHKNFMNIG